MHKFLNDLGADGRGKLAVGLLALLAASAVSLIFAPGFMSFDSLSQYRQALGIQALESAHPVVMVYLWSVLKKLTGTPSALLVFHQLLYWGALALFVCLAVRALWLRVVLLLMLGGWPPLAITSIHIWKDVGMMSALALATGCVLAYARRPAMRWVVGTLLALFYASAVRVNGLIPAVFLLAMLAYLVLARRGFRGVKLVAVGAGAMVGLLAIHLALMSALNAPARKVIGFGTLAVWDIASVSLAEGKNLLPPYLEKTGSGDLMADIRAKNSRDANYPLFEVISPYPPAVYESDLRRDWLRVAFTYPQAYLQHRAHVFALISGVYLNRPIYYPFHPGIDTNDLGLQMSNLPPKFLSGALYVFDAMSRWVIYRPWLYMVLAVVVIAFALARLWRRPAREAGHAYAIAGLVAASGLVNGLAMFLFATAADFRYMTWTIFAALLGTVLAAATWCQERSAS